MISIRLSTIGLLAALGAATACRKSEPKPEKNDSAQSMADMPGMSEPSKTDSTSVTLTAAQITHGGVEWGKASIGASSGTAVVPGSVSPNEDRTARLGAPARGRVLNVNVSPGDRVTAGQVLVTMQSPEAGMAQSDVSKAEAELASRRAEAQYAASARARADRLLALKAIPRQDYDRAVTDDEHARAAVTQAEAEARRARATAEQLSVGTNASGEVTLRSPLAGVVLTRTAVPGTVVEAGAPLVVVTDPSNLWLEVKAPEQFTALYRRGGRLRFTVPAYPVDTFAARIEAVGAGLEPETRTLPVRAAIVNAGGRLKPEMFANAIVEGGGSASAAMVPEDAVQSLDGKPHVFLARPDGKSGASFERREVVVGARAGGRVAILRGLNAGDVVVLKGAFAVKAQFEKAKMPKMEM